MSKRIWNFEFDGKPHQVLLKFGLISGRQIWVDNVLVNKGRQLFEFGSEYHFLVADRPSELGIVSTATGYEFYLRVDNKFVFPHGDQKQTVGKYTLKKFNERQKWIDFGSQHDLQYLPRLNETPPFNHRLIGYRENFLVIIGLTKLKVGDAVIPAAYVLIRHALLSTEKQQDLKQNENVKKFLKEAKVPANWLEVSPEGTSLCIKAREHKSNEFTSIEILISFLAVISNHVRPSQTDRCEGSQCTARYYQDLTLVLLNGEPLLMCEDCIDRISDLGKQAEIEYKRQPDNLLNGLLYGMAAAGLGALGWALLQIFFDRISAVFAVAIFALIIKAMDYAKTKRTFKSLFLAAVLALSGSLVGTYLGVAGYLYREGKFELKVSEFIWLAKKMIANHELIDQTVIFALLVLIPYLFLAWQSNKRSLSMYFRPQVELIKNFQLKL